jgi:hypothetical protein
LSPARNLRRAATEPGYEKRTIYNKKKEREKEGAQLSWADEGRRKWEKQRGQKRAPNRSIRPLIIEYIDERLK